MWSRALDVRLSEWCCSVSMVWVQIPSSEEQKFVGKYKMFCTSFRNRQNSEPWASFSGLFRSEYKWILYLTTMYVYCVYPAMSTKSENLSDLNKKDRNKRHSSPFINVVKGVLFVVRVTLVPVSYLSVPSAVHSYRVPGKFIRRLKSLFV